MKVTVRTGSWARQYMPRETAELQLPEGAAVADAIGRLDIPPQEIGLVALDGKAVPLQTPLAEGDIVRVFPVIIGG